MLDENDQNLDALTDEQREFIENFMHGERTQLDAAEFMHDDEE